MTSSGAKIKPLIPMNRPARDCQGGERDDKKLFGGGTYGGDPFQVTPAERRHARDPGRQIAGNASVTRAYKAASSSSAATAGSRISGALPRATANSHQTFFQHLPRRRRGQLEMDALSPDPDQSWRIRFHSVRKVTRSLGLQKDIFAPFLCLFENGGCLPAAGGLASVLDVPGGCISVPGWRCRRICRRLPLRNARQLVNFKRGGGRVSPPRAYVDACDLGKPREIAAPFGGREGVRDYIAARASIAFAQAL
jgi:hypothetical protein